MKPRLIYRRIILVLALPLHLLEGFLREIGRTWHNMAFLHRFKAGLRQWKQWWVNQ